MPRSHPSLPSVAALAALALQACVEPPAPDDDDVGDDDDTPSPACAPAADPAADWAELVAGVATLDSGGAQPDALVLHGPSAFPVVADEAGVPFVAAARLDGGGRLVVFAHEAYLGGLLSEADGGRLADNAVRWAGAAESPVVGVAPGTFDALADRLRTDGLSVVEVAPADLDAAVDVYVFTAYPGPSDAEQAAVRAFAAAGGGLVLGGQAWWFTYSTGQPAEAFSGNLIAGDLGIWFAGTGAVSAGTDVVAAAPPSPLDQGSGALAALLAHETTGPTLSDSELRRAAAAAGPGITALPLGMPFFACARAVADAVGPVVITADAPLVRADRPVEELVVRLDARWNADLPAEELWAHAAGDDFPGAVGADAERVTRSVTVDGTHAGIDPSLIYSGAGAAAWRSTGLYAPPGAILSVTTPASATGAGLFVQIGAHEDTLWHLDAWERTPSLVRRDALDAADVATGSLFGGPVYVVVPVGAMLGPVTLSIAGAVEAPRFVRGVTTDAAWVGGLRDAPGPWAELETESFVLTVPSEAARAVDSPSELLEFWQEVLDADADLYGIPHARPRAERFVVDRQISAGWMHSGYPIMAHLASAEEVTSLSSLRTTGSWGAFHELGHNHQHGDFVLPGTTEGNVNLFSVYAAEEVAGIDRADAHPALAAGERADRIADYLAGGANFADWSVWTALETYLQLQEGFGWEPYPQLFALYRGLDATGGHPQTDQERVDLFAQAMSDLVERDLGPFFVAWGLPVSAAVLQDVAAWPAWDEDPMTVAR